jgi:DNA (cytosine-5)-methyltransferase 1
MDKLKVISLFSGIGAQERGLQELGIDYELLNYCEIDDGKAKAYSLLHNESIEKRWKDITSINKQEIKQCDLVVYSPPCQGWSKAGKELGLNDIRSTLFWNALDVIKAANPKYAIMENVDNLPNRFTDEFNEMLRCLDDAGYDNYWQVINAKDFWPQSRNRVYIVSIRKDIDDNTYNFPCGNDTSNWWDKIDPYDTRELTSRQSRMVGYAKGLNNDDNIKLEGEVRFDNTVITLRQSGLRFQSNREHPTITAYMGKGGGNFTILAYKEHIGGIKPRGCFKLMGFKEEDCDLLQQNGFSVSSLYVMAGDSVVVPVIREIERNLLNDYINR